MICLYVYKPSFFIIKSKLLHIKKLIKKGIVKIYQE